MNAKSVRLYVGTIGEGLWRSLDGGETFARTCSGMFFECHVPHLRGSSSQSPSPIPRHRAGTVSQPGWGRPLETRRVAS